MTLVPPLLRCLLLIDGDALVLRAGDMPHVLAPSGRVDLSDAALDRAVVGGLIGLLLPEDVRSALGTVGAAQHELRDLPEFPGERFNVTAATARDDVWIEVRRTYRDAPDERRMPLIPGSAEQTVRPAASPAISHAANNGLGHVDDALAVATDRQELRWLIGQMRQRHASGLYLAANERPAVRVDTRVEPLRDAPPMAPAAIRGLWRAFVDDGSADDVSDHVREIPELGHVRGRRSDDAQGMGVVLVAERMRAELSPYMALPAGIRALALERRGLVIHAGPAGASGQRTLRAALVDVINRTRQAHVITIEHETTLVHDRKASLISQRDATGTSVEDLVAAARLEHPDVLVVEAAAEAPLMMSLIAEAASRLVICGLEAADAGGALMSVANTCDGDARTDMLRALSVVFKGAIGQVLVPRRGGGRLAARELILGTPPVLKALASGRLSQLPLLVADGRKDGMNTLNDALVRVVEAREVDPQDALAAAVDPGGLREALRRRGCL